MAGKIDKIQLTELLEQGLTQQEVARRLGVSGPAVLKARRKFGLALAAEIAAKKQLRAVTDGKKNVADRLMDLVQKMEEELKYLDEAYPRATSKEYREIQAQKIAHSAEIRKLLSTLGEISYKLYQAHKIERTLQIIMECVAEESNELREKIAVRLRRASANFEGFG